MVMRESASYADLLVDGIVAVGSVMAKFEVII
jgi:hypothetical protein